MFFNLRFLLENFKSDVPESQKDDIIDLHFNSLKHPVISCNTVLKRLRRDGHIEVNTDHQPFLYFSSPTPIKKDSVKIPHFLEIVKLYKSLLQFEYPKELIVEPKYGKGQMDPDAFMIWKRAPFFLEIQRSVYSERVMGEKVKRYEDYYFSNEWQIETWQPQNKKIFPPVIMITDTRYNLSSSYVRFYQVPNVSELVKAFEPKHQEIKVSETPLKLIKG